MYTMEEYRNGMMDLDLFPERIATLGLTALVMVFHPTYQEDYEVSCEGLSRWHGGLAWQLHFRQKADKQARLRSYRVNSMSYPIALRGRAWISAETFQIVTLETDLVKPLPQIQLRAEHISVEYAPVQFISRQQRLWVQPRSLRQDPFQVEPLQGRRYSAFSRHASISCAARPPRAAGV